MLPYVTADQVKKYVAANGGGGSSAGGGAYKVIGNYRVIMGDEGDLVFDGPTPDLAEIEALVAQNIAPILNVNIHMEYEGDIQDLNCFAAYTLSGKMITDNEFGHTEDFAIMFASYPFSHLQYIKQTLNGEVIEDGWDISIGG